MEAIQAGDTAFLLMCTALVVFMTPGLALFYGGMVRSKNVLGTLMESFVLIGTVPMVWAVVGYTPAFGPTWGDSSVPSNGSGSGAWAGAQPRLHGHRAAPCLHDVPGYVRRHHPDADNGRFCGAHEVHHVPGLQCPLVGAGVRPGGPLGVVQWRLDPGVGRALFCGRHRGAHQLGRGRPGRGVRGELPAWLRG